MSLEYSNKDFIDGVANISNVLPLTYIKWGNTFIGTHAEAGSLLLNPFFVPSNIVVEDDGYMVGYSEEIGGMLLALLEDYDYQVMPMICSVMVEGPFYPEIREATMECLSRTLMEKLLEKAAEDHKVDTSPASYAYLEYIIDVITTDASGICRLQEPETLRDKVMLPAERGHFYESLPHDTTQHSLDNLGRIVANLRGFVL